MKNKNFTNGQDLPMGLSMAMAQNPQAFEHFAELPSQQKAEIINAAHTVKSKAEMQQLVNGMAENIDFKYNSFL